MEIQGNIVPRVWYRTILTGEGKSHMLAIAILSDVVCGLKVYVKRDAVTGEIIGFGKKKYNNKEDE